VRRKVLVSWYSPASRTLFFTMGLQRRLLTPLP
jgi:hypothetical protein